MINSNLADNGYYLPNDFTISTKRAKLYFSRRKYLKQLIETIHSRISYNSQSFFLSLFLMDTIFLKANLEKIFLEHFPLRASAIPSNDIQLNNYVLLSLVCLIIAYKFNGNKSMMFPLNKIVKIIYYISGGKFGFSQRDLVIGEACVIKILKYKLNFYTMYHYLAFFFTNGIILKKNLNMNLLAQEKKILEKIYIQSRKMLDYIIDQEKYFELYNGKHNYILVSQILNWATEKILNIKIENNENIFKVVYNINITDEQEKIFLEIVDEKYKTKNTKNNFINKDYIYNSPRMNITKSKTNYYTNVSTYISTPNIINLDSSSIINPDISFDYINKLDTSYYNLNNSNININKEIEHKSKYTEPLDSQRNNRIKQTLKSFYKKRDKYKVDISESEEKILSIKLSDGCINLNNIKNDNDNNDISLSYVKFNNTFLLNKMQIKEISENQKETKSINVEPKDNKRKNRINNNMSKYIKKEINDNINTIIINNHMNINNYDKNNNNNNENKQVSGIINIINYK